MKKKLETVIMCLCVGFLVYILTMGIMEANALIDAGFEPSCCCGNEYLMVF